MALGTNSSLYKSIAAATLLACNCVSAEAQTLYSFLNTQVSFLDWSSKTETKTQNADFLYFTIEGGIGWDWGEFYGNFNIENPFHSYKDSFPSDLRLSGFGDFDIKIAKGFRLHMQNYHLQERLFYVNDFVFGFSYKYNHKNFWIKPFFGLHHTYSTYYKDLNGYIGGWVFAYDFEMFHTNFQLAQWNEIEFKRKKSYYLDSDDQPVGDGKSWGFHGALSLWWLMNRKLTTGVQYRYAQHKLGHFEYQNAWIYTIKYNF